MVLVGRDPERRTLGTLLASARVGDSRVLVLSGEPGIGKTALLGEAETAAGDMRVLRCQGVESEHFVPFAGLHQLLRPVLGLLDQIPEPQRRALSAALLLAPSSDGEPSRFAVGAATLSLICRAAEDRPVAVLVDDAHLLDSPSAEALVFAARRLIADAVAVVVTVRDREPGAALWSSLPRLALHGLDLGACTELVTGAFGPIRGDQVAHLHRATAGNPLALLELGPRSRGFDTAMTHSPVAVSDQIVRSFIGRVRDLTDGARAGLLVAAADSASVSAVQDACAVLGWADAGLAEAVAAGLVTVEGDRLQFRHPLVRSAVYGAADLTTRRAVHRALAEVTPPSAPDRLAWHLSESAVAPDEGTATLLDRTAEGASSRGAYALAADAFERAASLTAEAPRRAERLAAAGEAAWLGGLTDRAVHLLDRALGSQPTVLLQAHVCELRGAVETRCGSLDLALTTLLEAAEIVRSVDADTAVRLFADAIHVAFYLGDPGSAMRACASIDALVDRCVDPDTRSLGVMASGMALVLDGQGIEGIARVRTSAYSLVITPGAAHDRFRLPLRLQGALWLRDTDPQRVPVDEAINRMRDEAALGSLPYLLMHIARDGATTDRWDDAEAAYLEAIRLAEETGQTTDLAMSLAGLAGLEARRGRAAPCLEAVAAADALIQRHHLRLPAWWLRFAEGDLAAGQGDPVTAAGHYEALVHELAERGLADPDQSCAPELIEVYVHLGRPADARRLADAFAVQAAAKAQPWSLARAERALALCTDRAEEHFLAALELHARTPDRYETARTGLAYGSWLRRGRRRVDARPLLRAALATFDDLGAAPWADAAAHELEATGQTVPRRRADALSNLTPQERQIAQMLAEGRTTRQAAAALFLSPKTVEYHLRHVYMKLDVRSRAALPQALTRSGDEPRSEAGHRSPE